MNLTELAVVLRRAAGVVGVDGGPAHLAAAMSTPMVCLYGATSPLLTGTWGDRCTNLQGVYECVPCMKKQCMLLTDEFSGQPCFGTLQPELVLSRLIEQIESNKNVVRQEEVL